MKRTLITLVFLLIGGGIGSVRAQAPNYVPLPAGAFVCITSPCTAAGDRASLIGAGSGLAANSVPPAVGLYICVTAPCSTASDWEAWGGEPPQVSTESSSCVLGTLYHTPNGKIYSNSGSGSTCALLATPGGADPCSGNPTNGSGLFCVDDFPTSCTVSSVNYATQLDCADATAIAYMVAEPSLNVGPVLYFGSPHANYNTNVGVLLAPASWTADDAISLLGAGPFNTTISQHASVSTGTVYLPAPKGSGDGPKRFFVRGMTIRANDEAPYALQILGYHYQSQFEDLVLRSGSTGPAIFGTTGSTSTWGYQDTFKNIWATATSTGSGATGTVSLSGGVPSIAITAGGTGMDSSTRAWLVGYQSGTALNPCSTMGTIAVTISGGAVTAATPSGFSGCSGSVYLVFDDDPNQFGLDFDYITDSTFTDIKSQSGWEAGVLLRHGANALYHVHSFPHEGKFCIENHAANTFDSLEMGECSLAELDNNGTEPTAIALVTTAAYNSAYQFSGQAMFRNELSGDQIYAHDISCNTIQTAEYHTLATPSGTIDANTSAETSAGDEMYNIQYCGSGTGGTLNFSSRAFTFPGMYPTLISSADIDRTGLSANVSATTLYAVPSGLGGMYRISADTMVSEAAQTSSTLPSSGITWTDEDTGATGIASTLTSTSSLNMVGHGGQDMTIIRVAGGSTITYDTASYASSGATAMQYNLHIRVEYLGP